MKFMNRQAECMTLLVVRGSTLHTRVRDVPLSAPLRSSFRDVEVPIGRQRTCPSPMSGTVITKSD